MDQLEVRVHSEISTYSEKFYGLTFRQWICVALSIILDVPVMVLLKNYISMDILEYVIIAITVPIMAVGFIRVQDLEFEKFFRYFMRTYMSLYKPIAYISDKAREEEKKYYEALSPLGKLKYLIKKDRESDSEKNNETDNKLTDRKEAVIEKEEAVIKEEKVVETEEEKEENIDEMIEEMLRRIEANEKA